MYGYLVKINSIGGKNMTKKNTKKEEAAIILLVQRYKLLICQQIKAGTNCKDGMLFDPSCDYKTFWKLSSGESLTDDERELCRINFVLASLNKKEMEIIWKEFFFPEDKFWWMQKYNRSTYYRLRNKAIKNFYRLM